jgi:hypothetical protein
MITPFHIAAFWIDVFFPVQPTRGPAEIIQLDLARSIRSKRKLRRDKILRSIR